jgi:hypothetical protein
MDLAIVLVCEYIFSISECQTYLRTNNINPEQYEYVHKEYDIKDVVYKKRTRKLINVSRCHLTEYPNLIYLRLHYEFNEIIHKLPNSLLHLHTGCHFNQNIVLSPNLNILRIGHDFNKIIRFSNSLRCIQNISGRFNQSLSDLPHNLLYLGLGFHFNQHLPILPSTLRGLSLGFKFDSNIPRLPDNLRYLSVWGLYNGQLILPNKLEILIWNCHSNIPELSDGLLRLYYGVHFHRFRTRRFIPYPDEIKVLPNKLKYLLWNCCDKFPELPNDLLVLVLYEHYQHKIHKIPNSIRQITVIHYYKHISYLTECGIQVNVCKSFLDIFHEMCKYINIECPSRFYQE